MSRVQSAAMKALIASLLIFACVFPLNAQSSTRKKSGSSRKRRSAYAVTPADTCRAFVQKFYVWYTSKPVQENGDTSADALARRRYPNNFSAELKRALEADEQAAAKHPDEVVGLDGDPFLNTQELADRYYPGVATVESGICKVPMFGVNLAPNQPTEKHLAHQPDVTAILKKVGSAWVFQDFIYDKDETLLSVLKQLAKDRENPPQEKKAAVPAASASPAPTTVPETQAAPAAPTPATPKPDEPKTEQPADPK